MWKDLKGASSVRLFMTGKGETLTKNEFSLSFVLHCKRLLWQKRETQRTVFMKNHFSILFPFSGSFVTETLSLVWISYLGHFSGHVVHFVWQILTEFQLSRFTLPHKYNQENERKNLTLLRTKEMRREVNRRFLVSLLKFLLLNCIV